MLLIGICGASGSGKTTLANELTKALGCGSVVINQDAYYQDHPDLSFEERVRLNYDEPGIFDHDLLYQDVCALLSGQPVTKKAYDFSRHRRADTGETVYPAPILIVEGIHAFHDPRLMEKMFLRLYVSTDPDICLLRRIRRDIKERGRHIDDIAEQYLTTVKPMYERYIRGYIHRADMVVPFNQVNPLIVPLLTSCLQDEIDRQRQG